MKNIILKLKCWFISRILGYAFPKSKLALLSNNKIFKLIDRNINDYIYKKTMKLKIYLQKIHLDIPLSIRNPKTLDKRIKFIMKCVKYHPFCDHHYRLRIKGKKATISSFPKDGYGPNFTKEMSLLLKSN